MDSIGCAYPNCTVGIDELGSKEIVVDVWPNPVSDVLNVDFSVNASSGRALEMTVFDVSGREMLKQVQHDPKGVIDVSNWASGIYILRGTDDRGKAFSLKFVKE